MEAMIMKLSVILFILVTAHASKKKLKRTKLSKLNDANAAYQTYRKPNADLDNRPNIVLILTDDQDTELGSLQFMPKLSKFMREKGAKYEHGYVSTPMCCPSRSSLLTGLYVHNHHVFTNNDNCSSTFWIENHEKRTFATYLQQSGYRTAYYGKYLNKYDGNRVPPGWDEWNGLVKNSQFYNYTLNYNGIKRNHGNNYARDYLPDLITNRSVQFISERDQSPFLAVLSYPAPHGPEDSAPQFQDLFFNVSTHHTPAYDFAPNPDKQWILRNSEKMLPIHRSFTDMLMTKRLQTLQSVDSGVEQVVKELKKTGQLKNTYIFYTSDHGYHLGQFGLVKGKAFPFDFDTKVPFIVRGPGIAPRSIRKQPVLNIDLAPTFLDLAGLEKPPHMDGKSILPTLRNPNKKFRNSFLIERGKMTFERYATLSQNSVLKDESLLMLKKKKLSKQERLEVQCRKPRYQSPCSLSQKWVCKEKADGTKKISRCHGKVKNGGTKTSRKKMNNKCHCQPGEIFGWKYIKLDLDEKKMQKKFLKQNLKLENLKKLKPKFLKTIPTTLSRHGRSTEESQLVESMMDDMADEEIKEVDLLVEDIAEEIRDLHTLKNSTDATGCKMAAQNVICESSVIENESEWLNSRSTIKQQISQLRSQLKELKQIRKYLGKKKPNSRKEVVRKTLKSRMDTSFPFIEQDSEACVCDTKKGKGEMKAQLKAEREAKRMERKMDKLRRKERKRLKSERKSKRKFKRHEHCKSDVKLNCFSHDNDHWRTAPLWTEGPFCACTNSNNNTYWCVRNINATANYLYCEYVTGMMTYFDLTVDPHQLRNLLHTLTDSELNYMHQQVMELRNYSAEDRFWERRRRMKNLQKEEKLRKRKRKERRQKESKRQKILRG